MRRLSESEVLKLDAGLSDRRRKIVQAAADFRLVTGHQLRCLLEAERGQAPNGSRARRFRADLSALTATHCLFRLDRRIGGVRSGSAGYVYALGAVGRRLVDLWSGQGLASPRSRYEPSVGFQNHALAVTGCVIDTVALARASGTAVDYRIEKRAWRSYLGSAGTQELLKPDAALQIDGDGFTDHWWLEVDRGTERAAAVRRQLDAYVAYYRSGHEQRDRGVFPLVAWLTVDERRANLLREVIARVPADGQPLFRVGLIPEGPAQLLSGFGAAS